MLTHSEQLGLHVMGASLHQLLLTLITILSRVRQSSTYQSIYPPVMVPLHSTVHDSKVLAMAPYCPRANAVPTGYISAHKMFKMFR